MSPLSNSAVGTFHEGMKNIFSPLPKDHKVIEVIKRIAMIIFAPLLYPVLGVASLVGYLFTKGSSSDDIYFIRYLNIQTKNPCLANLLDAVKEDLTDYNKGYQKGACLYTPNSIQPLPAFDPRHSAISQIAVEYPFALLIEPKVELHYWSLTDLDRNMNREYHERAKKNGVQKYKPTSFHNLFAEWKTVHFTGVDAFISKVENIAKAARDHKKDYITSGGKHKKLERLKAEHNEGSITYNPEKNAAGILIRNTPQDLQLATQFKNSYKDSNGSFVFKNAFLAYQNAQGKIVRF